MARHPVPRKLVHLATAVFALLYVGYGLDRRTMLWLTGAALVASLVVDFLRHWLVGVQRFAEERLSGYFLPRDRGKVSSASWLFLAYVILVALLPRETAALAILFASVGDVAAWFVGSRWGSYRVGKGTALGSLACFLTCLLLSLLFVEPRVGLLGAAAATVGEALPSRIDDNLLVSLYAGFALALGGLVFV